jgi:hypothetical protein
MFDQMMILISQIKPKINQLHGTTIVSATPVRKGKPAGSTMRKQKADAPW